MPRIKDEEKCLFAIDDKKEVVIIGLSDASWNFMKDGLTHTLDLRSLGVPFRIILFGGRTRAELMKSLNITPDTLDVSGIDFGFGGEGNG